MVSSARMSLLRERRRKGLRCIQAEIRETEVVELIRRGFLKDADRQSKSALRDALYGFLDQNLNPASSV